MRQIEGEERTAQWLRDMIANGVSEYRNNSTQVQAVGDGEIDIGLVNHYYLFRFTKEDAGYPAANHYTDAGRAGALINIAGLGILAGAENQAAALTFVRVPAERHRAELLPRPDLRVPAQRPGAGRGRAVPGRAFPALPRAHRPERP